MAFIRKKQHTTKDGIVRDYYSVVENCRVEGKVKQKVIGYLGLHPTVEDAIESRVFSLFHLSLLAAYWETRRQLFEEKYGSDHDAIKQWARWAVGERREVSKELLWLWERLESIPQQESALQTELSGLRLLAERLGVTDSEALALPQTSKFQAIEKDAKRYLDDQIGYNEVQEVLRNWK